MFSAFENEYKCARHADCQPQRMLGLLAFKKMYANLEYMNHSTGGLGTWRWEPQEWVKNPKTSILLTNETKVTKSKMLFVTAAACFDIQQHAKIHL